jgi:hypothetical protein
MTSLIMPGQDCLTLQPQAPPSWDGEALRRLAAAGRAVGEDGAAPAAAVEAPSRQPAGGGPGGDGRHLLRVALGLPRECAVGDGHLLVLLGAPPLPGMSGRRGVRGGLAQGAAGLRRAARDRLDLASTRRSDGRGAAERGEKPAAIRPTAACHSGR